MDEICTGEVGGWGTGRMVGFKMMGFLFKTYLQT